MVFIADESHRFYEENQMSQTNSSDRKTDARDVSSSINNMSEVLPTFVMFKGSKTHNR